LVSFCEVDCDELMSIVMVLVVLMVVVVVVVVLVMAMAMVETAMVEMMVFCEWSEEG